MNVNAFLQKDYENETAFRPQKNKPNSNPIKANFFKGQNELKIACQKIWPFQQTKKKFWTIPNEVVRITVLDELTI